MLRKTHNYFININILGLYGLATIYRVWKYSCKNWSGKCANMYVIAKHTIYANGIGLFFRVALGIVLAGTVKNGQQILLILRVSNVPAIKIYKYASE